MRRALRAVPVAWAPAHHPAAALCADSSSCGLQQDRQRPGLSLGGWIEQSDGKPFPLEAQYSWYLSERALRARMSMPESYAVWDNRPRAPQTEPKGLRLLSQILG
ncbi:MAG: hypothetical protein ACRD7E_22000, partial [Bryobacteraceae bacterium]